MRARLMLGTALAGAAMFAAAPAEAQWYARLDSGFAWARDADFQDNFTDQLNDTFVIGREESRPGALQEIGSSWLIDGGIGFRFNPWLRTDLTVGYRGGYALDDWAEEVETFEAAFSRGSESGTAFAEITSIPVLLNAYIDLGGVTTGIGPNIVPYVGAGFGFARNGIDDIQFIAVTQDPVIFMTAPGGTNVDLAWAVMAGFTAPLSGVRNLFLDVGYRYLDSGKIETDGGMIVGAEGDGQGNGIGFSVTNHTGFNADLTAHEFKAGLRLMLP